MRRRPTLAALGGLLAAACSPVALLNATAPRRGLRHETALAYGPGGRQGIDLHAPQDAAGAPTLVFFYGGSWQSGDRGMYRFLGASLASAGMVCLVPDYRVWPEAGFPAFMEDAAQAVAWARRHAGEHGGDPDRLVLMGHSAGAQMAALLALDGRYLAAQGMRPDMLQGVVGLAGPYDFLPLRDPTLQAIFGPREAWPASQPVNFVAPGAPPMLLATGEQDSVVLPRNTDRLAARLEAAGNEVRRVHYAGIGHQEILGAFAPALRFLAPVRDEVLGFVTEHAA